MNPNRESRKSGFAGAVFCLIILCLLATPLAFNSYTKLNKQTLYFYSVSHPITNPLMGWAPWANTKDIYQPHTLVYADLTWRDFEPQEGVFDFEAFEEVQQLARWRHEGKRVVFRFVIDVPRGDSHMDIPDWLFEKINGDGEFYDNVYGKGFSPNYSNLTLIKYHQLAINALGSRYGNDGFFAFIELGSLGHWGEWHVSSELRQLPSENIRNMYVYHYLNAFPGVHLLVRRPFTIARDLSLGLFNDMTGNVEHTNGWLDWIQNGGVYLPGEKDTIVPMANGWEFAPVGGEQAPDISNEQMYGVELETTLQLLRRSHTTFIGPGGPYEIKIGGALQSGIDQVLTTIGYRLYIHHVEMPLSVRFGDEAQIKFSFSNDGIAPFYYDWPAMVYLFGESGEIVGSYPLEMDLRKILPNQIYATELLLPIGDLENGKYTVGFAIIDPLTGLPGVKLANESSRDDLIVEVGTFEIDRIFK
jgi:hypothetical protein